jgi:hypothetical protein
MLTVVFQEDVADMHVCTATVHCIQQVAAVLTHLTTMLSVRISCVTLEEMQAYLCFGSVFWQSSHKDSIVRGLHRLPNISA